jgi:chromosome segregation ATPase
MSETQLTNIIQKQEAIQTELKADLNTIKEQISDLTASDDDSQSDDLAVAYEARLQYAFEKINLQLGSLNARLQEVEADIAQLKKQGIFSNVRCS